MHRLWFITADTSAKPALFPWLIKLAWTSTALRFLIIAQYKRCKVRGCIPCRSFRNAKAPDAHGKDTPEQAQSLRAAIKTRLSADVGRRDALCP